MRRVGLVAGAVILVGLSFGLLAGPVLGHALLASSDPAANATLATAPGTITLTFTEAPDPKLSSVQVLDASGASHASGPAVSTAAGSTTLRVRVGPLPDGVYTVAWRTVSAVDGHAAAGTFAFSVGAAAAASSAVPAAGSASPQGGSTVSAASVGGRWILYLGLVGLLGAIAASEVARRRGRWLFRFLAIAWLLAVGGASLIAVAQASDAGVGITDLAGTSLGWAALGRVVPLLVAGVLIVLARRWTTARRALLLVVAAIVAAQMLLDAIVSHAAAAPLPVLNIAIEWLHFVAVGAWIGGLAGILVELRGSPREEQGRVFARFSRWATVGIVVVALTGVIRAAVELGSPAELVTTEYGWLVLAKIALLVGLAGLGALNHFRHVPRAEDGVTGVRRIGSVEILVAAVALFVASLLVNVAPPVAMAAMATPPAPAGLAVDGHDYATTVKLHLTITPGTAGPNTFSATAVDYDTGMPVAATSIGLRFIFPGRPDVGSSTLTLAPTGGGTYAGTGSNLSLGGPWTVTALVNEPSAPVEVPLQVPVPTPPAKVDVNAAAALPTLYTVHLSKGRSAQLYLDSWAPGYADLHVTFFDAAGKELPVTGIAATVTAAGSPPLHVAMDPLEPGHAVGHLKTTAHVPMSVEITGTAPGGEQLDLNVDMTPTR